MSFINISLAEEISSMKKIGYLFIVMGLTTLKHCSFKILFTNYKIKNV